MFLKTNWLSIILFDYFFQFSGTVSIAPKVTPGIDTTTNTNIFLHFEGKITII